MYWRTTDSAGRLLATSRWWPSWWSFREASPSSPCHLCLWDSRNINPSLYEKSNWPLRTGYEVGVHNAKQEPLVEPTKVVMPPLHTNLGLVKQFVKQLNLEGAALKQIQKPFPRLSEAKIKAGVFVGPHVKRLNASDSFPEKLSGLSGSLDQLLFSSQRFPLKPQGWELQGNRWRTCGHVAEHGLPDVAETARTTRPPWWAQRKHGTLLRSTRWKISPGCQLFRGALHGTVQWRCDGDYIWNLLPGSELRYNRHSRRQTSFLLKYSAIIFVSVLYQFSGALLFFNVLYHCTSFYFHF